MLVPMAVDLRKRDFSLVDTLITDNGYLTPENLKDLKAMGLLLVAPFKPRNIDKESKLPRDSFMLLAEFAKSQPTLFAELKRLRQSIESIFWNEKRIDNHIDAIGTAAEREEHRALLAAAASAQSKREHDELADAAASAGLYNSRVIDFLLRVLCQILRRTVIMEHKWNRVGLISYTKDSVFGRVREYSEESPNAA